MSVNIDSILTEWRYRLSSGYPQTAQDFEVLRDVILEMTDIDLTAAERIVRRSMGLNNKSTDEQFVTEAPGIDGDIPDVFVDSDNFEDYILKHYSVPGQKIIGLQSLYDTINRLHPATAIKVFDLIRLPADLQLKTGVFPIRKEFEILYDVIKQTVKIPNGDESELWFAIVFDGKVVGAVPGESGIESDVIVGTQTVSLKNYESTTFDFGSLAPEATQMLNNFLEMAKLLTGQDISKSKGREQINSVLEFLDDEKVESDIRQLIELGNTSDIALLQNIGKRLQSFYDLDDNLDTMIHSFCTIIDRMVTEKLSTVGWWGMIVKGNKTLFLESSNDLIPVLTCKNDRLSPAIANFHQNKLFVLGSQLSTKVTKKTRD
jgi:hypothetical protein